MHVWHQAAMSVIMDRTIPTRCRFQRIRGHFNIFNNEWNPNVAAIVARQTIKPLQPQRHARRQWECESRKKLYCAIFSIEKFKLRSRSAAVAERERRNTILFTIKHGATATAAAAAASNTNPNNNNHSNALCSIFPQKSTGRTNGQQHCVSSESECTAKDSARQRCTMEQEIRIFTQSVKWRALTQRSESETRNKTRRTRKKIADPPRVLAVCRTMSLAECAVHGINVNRKNQLIVWAIVWHWRWCGVFTSILIIIIVDFCARQ